MASGPPTGTRVRVLFVAGEHHTVLSGESHLGLHCSLEHVAEAYERLRRHFPRDDMVVIAQLNETLAWLERASETGLPSFNPAGDLVRSRQQWAARLATCRRRCALLISEGGAHFDGASVNPATVVAQLAALGADPLTGTLLLIVYSHGWFHAIHGEGTPAQAALEARVECDICGSRHDAARGHTHSSLKTQEWYAHLPYPVPEPERARMYATVAHESHEHYACLLYWQLLFARFAEICTRARPPTVVAVYNFCASGGLLKFALSPAYQLHYGVAAWPLYQLAASGEQDGAIIGLVDIWVRQLVDALDDDAHAQSTTLGALFRSVDDEYHATNPGLRDAHEADDGLDAMCLLCRTFRGSPELCSVCTRKRRAAHADEAAAMDAQIEMTRGEAADGSSGARTPRRPRHALQAACALPDLEASSVASVFGRARKGAAGASRRRG